MILFSGDLIKFITYNVKSSKNVVYYGVCLNYCNLSDKDGFTYLNLYNDLESYVTSNELVSISLVGNVKSLLYQFKVFSNSLDFNRKYELTKECSRLIKERNKGNIVGFTNNNDLEKISSILNCNPLALASLVINRSSITSLCTRKSRYSKEYKELKSDFSESGNPSNPSDKVVNHNKYRNPSNPSKTNNSSNPSNSGRVEYSEVDRFIRNYGSLDSSLASSLNISLDSSDKPSNYHSINNQIKNSSYPNSLNRSSSRC